MKTAKLPNVALKATGAPHYSTKGYPFKRLVLALGSELARPDIPGLAGVGFDVDTYSAAVRLNDHIAALPAAPAQRAPAQQNGVSLDGMERRMIFDALAATGGHQQRAAARLGISRRTLSRKLKTYESERTSAPL